jgi:glyoxylase-like metal-dependent hydrolase (beta-lactamase superfamily II)
MKIQSFFDPKTSTLTYVPHDPDQRVAVVIDSLLDFDAASGRTATRSAEAVARFLDAQRLSVPFVLDTHVHADHLSAMPFFEQRFGAKTVIGAHTVDVQRAFRELFNLSDLSTDGSQFDVLMSDGDTIDAGPFEIRALHTPGHTPACVSYLIEDALFVGDALFQPDYGTARCDFPGGSADELHESIQRLYRELPDDTRVFTCHDYQPDGRPLAFESTLLEQRRSNVQLNAFTTREEFVAFRKQRDATLAMPDLILPSIQVNVRAGALPTPEANGISYLKIPLNTLGGPA